MNVVFERGTLCSTKHLNGWHEQRRSNVTVHLGKKGLRLSLHHPAYIFLAERRAKASDYAAVLMLPAALKKETVGGDGCRA